MKFITSLVTFIVVGVLPDLGFISVQGCTTDAACSQGVCVFSGESGVCVCNPGWTHEVLGVTTGPCTTRVPPPCIGNAYADPATGTCVCPPQFTGPPLCSECAPGYHGFACAVPPSTVVIGSGDATASTSPSASPSPSALCPWCINNATCTLQTDDTGATTSVCTCPPYTVPEASGGAGSPITCVPQGQTFIGTTIGAAACLAAAWAISHPAALPKVVVLLPPLSFVTGLALAWITARLRARARPKVAYSPLPPASAPGYTDSVSTQ